MRIVISGEGEIAYQLAVALQQQHDLVVIEEDPEVAARFERLDVQLLIGHSSSPEVLREAGIDAADSFVACGNSDEINIISSLTAKRLGCRHTTCVVSKEEYVRSFAGIVEGAAALAIDRVVWPQYMLADEIARIVLVPRAIDVEIFAGGRIWLMEFRLRADSPLLGPLPQLDLPRGVLAVAVRKGEDLFIPSGTTVLAADDRVAFMGGRSALKALQDRFVIGDPRKKPPRTRQVVIIGGGTVGLNLARRLERERDLRVKIIEVDRERSDELAAQLPRSLVLRGDGTDLELLESEQVNLASVLVSVTSNDEKNLLCSLLGKQMQVPRIITRVNRKENVRLFERVGIDVPLNPMLTALNVILNSLHDPAVQLLASVEGGKAAVLEIAIRPGFKPVLLKDLPRIEGSIIVAITRGDETIVPHGSDAIQPGDRLMVFATDAARDKVRKLF